MDLMFKVAADATALPDKVFDELCDADCAAAFEAMTGFFMRAGFLRAAGTS